MCGGRTLKIHCIVTTPRLVGGGAEISTETRVLFMFFPDR